MAKKTTKKTTKAPRQRADDLSARRAVFLREYLISRNATQAAIKAGYSEKTAAQQGNRLLRNVQIAEAIRQEDERALAAARVTQDAIIGELARIAFGDPRKVMEWGPTGVKLKKSDELSDADAAIVAEVSETRTETGGSIKLKTHNKVDALKELAKLKDLYPKDEKDKPDPTADSRTVKIEMPPGRSL